MSRVLPVLLLLVLVAASGVYADADLWWHIASGREILADGPPHVDTWSYIAAGRAWIHHEWIVGAALAACFDRFGTVGLLGWRALWLGVLAGSLALAVHRRTQHPLLTLIVVGVPLPFLAFLANLRPQTVTWALVPVAVVLLDRLADRRADALPLLVALAVLWVNLHGGFLFGWGLLGLGALLHTRHDRRAWLAVAGLCVVPFLNAYGAELVVYVLTEITVGHPGLPEWNAPSGAMAGLIVVVVLGVVASFGFARARVRPELVVGFGIAVVASFRAAKFVELVLLLAPVLVAPQVAVLYARARALPDGERLDVATRSWGVLIAVGGVLALYVARFTPAGGVHASAELYPLEALASLRGTPPHRLLVPLGWGGIAHATLPGWTVSLDGRNTTVYEPAWVQAHSDAMDTGDLEVLLRGDPEVALVWTGGPVDEALASRGWEAVVTTPTATVRARVPLQPANQGRVLAQFPGVDDGV